MRDSHRWAAALFVLLLGTAAMAQRHSGDMEQGYFNKPSDPILNIEDAKTKKWTYIRLSDLRRRGETDISVPDVRTGTTELFEGILLNDLVGNKEPRSFEIFKGGAFRDKLAFRSEDLDPAIEVFIVYSKNGRSLGSQAFWVIAGNKLGLRIVSSDLAYIRLE